MTSVPVPVPIVSGIAGIGNGEAVAGYVYWFEEGRAPKSMMRASFGRRYSSLELTPPTEWPLDMNVSGDSILYTVSPSGDPSLSDCRVVRLEADGASKPMAEHQWQPHKPKQFGSDIEIGFGIGFGIGVGFGLGIGIGSGFGVSGSGSVSGSVWGQMKR